MDLNSITKAASVVWLGILMLRLAMMRVPFASTPQGQTFMAAVNAILLGGLVLVGLFVGRSVLAYTAAKAMRSNHCQQCYAKLEEGSEFCPSCGKRI